MIGHIDRATARPRIDPYQSLCIYDPRHPNYTEPDPDEPRQAPRDGCHCDNCFYGRDALAMEIIRLQGALQPITKGEPS